MRLAVLFLALSTVAVLVAVFAGIVPFYTRQEDFEQLRTELLRAQVPLEQRLEQRADALGPTLTWSQFNANQTANAGRRVGLRQRDFRSGTVHIRESGVFQLEEDIEFAPNINNNFRVRRPQQDAIYPLLSGFRLDFFAAIAIEADEFVFDGRHHELRQHHGHALAQRFYAHIELANAPFIPPQGPVVFEQQFRAARNGVVKNMRFGRSAHFAVAGNNNHNVRLLNLDARDYEVAVFKLNGYSDMLVQNITGHGSFVTVPVNAEFSQATFLLPLMERLNGRNADLDAAYLALKIAHDKARADIWANGAIDAAAHPVEHALFASPSGVITGGTTYGFLLTDLGNAVGSLQFHFDGPTSGKRAFLEHVRINNTRSHVREFVALVDQAGNFMHGPVGGIPNLLRLRDVGSFAGDLLARAMVQFVRVYRTLPAHEQALLGKPNMPDAFVDWVLTTGGPLDGNLTALASANGWSIAANLDGMGHVNKGLFVARVQNSQDVYMQDIDLGDALADGPPCFAGSAPGSSVTVNPLTYTGQHGDGGHPDQFPMIGCHGNDAHAMVVASSRRVHMRRVRVGRVRSLHGTAVGLEQFGELQ